MSNTCKMIHRDYKVGDLVICTEWDGSVRKGKVKKIEIHGLLSVQLLNSKEVQLYLRKDLEFECCADCDQPDACSDFVECAIEEGLQDPPIPHNGYY